MSINSTNLQYSDKDDLRKTFFVLGKEHSFDILKYLEENGKANATKTARDLNIHVATAVKYLNEFYELELVDRRTLRGRSREYFEYELKNPKISIDVDLSKLLEQPNK